MEDTSELLPGTKMLSLSMYSGLIESFVTWYKNNHYQQNEPVVDFSCMSIRVQVQTKKQLNSYYVFSCLANKADMEMWMLHTHNNSCHSFSIWPSMKNMVTFSFSVSVNE